MLANLDWVTRKNIKLIDLLLKLDIPFKDDRAFTVRLPSESGIMHLLLHVVEILKKKFGVTEEIRKRARVKVLNSLTEKSVFF